MSGNCQSANSGPVAQLGARFHGMEEVVGSIPTRSTKFPNSVDSVSSDRSGMCVMSCVITRAHGLKSRIGYASRLTDDQLKNQLAARPVTYLLGEADILPLGVFDTSCPAMAQGPTRLARGLAFSRYVKEHHGANHSTVVVPFCGHSARCMFTSDVALPLIFPD